MNTFLKNIAIVGSLVAGLNVAHATECTPEYTVTTIKEGVLSVALTNTPPYSFEQDRHIAGIDGDLVNKFAQNNCLTVEYSIFTYPAAVSAVQSGRADIALGGFYRTAARQRVVALSTPAYLDQLAVQSVEGYDTVDQLIGKNVGTVEGYDWVQQMEEVIPGSKTYPSSLNLAQDVQAGRLDAGLEGFGAAVNLTKGKNMQVKLLQPDPRINATTLASQTSFLLSKKNQGLLDAMNNTLESYRADGTIGNVLEAHGLPASAAEVGEERNI